MRRALAVPASAATVFRVDDGGNLISFDTATPGTLLSVGTISGVTAGTKITDIDFRPATGTLSGLGNGNRLHTIDTSTGAATMVGTPLNISSLYL